MRSRFLIPFLALALVAIATGLPDASAAPHIVRTLPNKSTLVVRENRTRPLVSVQAWVRSGARDEISSDRGVSSVLTRMLPRATQKYGPRQIERELSALSGSSR